MRPMARSPQAQFDGNSADRAGGSIAIELDLLVAAIHAVQIMNVQQVPAQDVEALQATLRVEAGLAAQIEGVSIGRELVVEGI